MKKPTLCLLNPGAMGSAFGAIAHATGHRVVWVSEGRGTATHARAAQAQLEAVPDLATALAQADIVLSICPPHAATQVAHDVAARGFAGVYCDANAISPDTARSIGQTVARAGARFVDGGIIGTPPRGGSTLRLCLAGEVAARIADVFSGSAIEPVVLDAPIGAASAMKICYAAWTKGTVALLESICAVAQQERVLEPLQAEWRRSQPDLEKRLAQLPSTVGKSWRWEGEMQEVAQLFAACGLPGGFHAAAAEVFGRLGVFKDEAAVPLERIVQQLQRGGH